MSPEQALAKRIPIDHRTDIYSLGVTLYELLTLQPALIGRDRQELLRQIAFEEPRRPRRVNSAIPTELETIVLKAVNKNPEQRYATAQDLADDLTRFLEDKPIRAKRPTIVERTAKWSRRHRHLVASAAVVLVLAVVGLSISTALIWQEQARTASALADAEAQRAKAEEQKALAEAVYEFMHETLTTDQPNVSYRQVLDEAAAKIDSAFPDQPLVEAEVRNMIQAMYVKLGEYDLAEPHAREMVAIRQRELGEEDPQTLKAMNILAWVLQPQGKTSEAERLYRRILDSRRRLLGEEHDLTLTAMNSLALLLQEDGRADEAEPLARRAVEARRRILGDEDEETLRAMHNLALVLERQGKLSEAGPLKERVLEIVRQTLGDEHAHTMVSMHNLARHYLDMGKPG